MEMPIPSQGVIPARRVSLNGCVRFCLMMP